MKFFRHFDITTGREYIMAREGNRAVVQELNSELLHRDIFPSDTVENRKKNAEFKENYIQEFSRELADKVRGNIC